MIESLDITLSEASDMLARVVVRPRLKPMLEGRSLRLAGFIRGPICDTSQTLPAEFTLVETPASEFTSEFTEADPPEASATIVDPCYWTPDLPMMYAVTLQLIDDQQPAGQQVVAQRNETIGFHHQTK